MFAERFGFKPPRKSCQDKKCPFHGKITFKKEFFRGIVIKKDAHRSATIEWERPYYIPKYERYEIRRSRLRVHNPPCIDASIGQEVLVARTRPLSKTKNHVILCLIKGEVKKTKKENPKEKLKDHPKKDNSEN